MLEKSDACGPQHYNSPPREKQNAVTEGARVRVDRAIWVDGTLAIGYQKLMLLTNTDMLSCSHNTVLPGYPEIMPTHRLL